MRTDQKNYYEGTDQVESEGILLNDQKEGEWKWYYSDGILKNKGIYKGGEPNGPFYYYHENGKESANGIYRGEKREGDWVWTFDTGITNQYGHYVDGELDGPYHWFHPTGEPSTTGAFLKGQRHGNWIWQNPNGAVVHQIAYDAGKMHGLNQKYSGDGSRTEYIKNYHQGALHGPFELLDADGTVIEKGSYVMGKKHGEYYDLVKGKLKKSEFDHGVPLLTEKKWQSIAKQLAKKKDNYAKMDLLDKHCDYSAKVNMLWYMIKHDYLDASEHTDLWYELRSDLSVVRSEDVVNMLKGIELNATQLKRVNTFLPFWPMSFDEICMKLYAKDPGPFDEGWASFPENVKEGFKTVLIRFGKLDKSAMKKNMAVALAQEQLDNYGIGVQGGGIDGSFSNIWWQKDGEVFQLNISKSERGGLPNEHFYELITLFTTPEKWKAALLKLALKKDYNLPLPHSMDAIKIADRTQFIKLFKGFSTSAYSDFYWALTELRQDTIEDLEMMAQELRDGKLIGQRAAILIVVAILRHKGAGTTVPDYYDEYFNFDSYYHSKDGTGKYFMGIEYVAEALAYLPKSRIDSLFKRQLADEYYWDRCIPFLSLCADHTIWDQAIAMIEEKLKPDLVLSNLMPIYLGLARLENEDLGWLAQKIEMAKQPQVREVLVLAMICLLANLAEKGQSWPKIYDQYFELYNWAPKYGDDYDYYIASFFQKALWSLSPERQATILEPLIDGNEPTFIRIFSLLDENTPLSILQELFAVAAKYKIKKPNTNWIEKVLRERLKDKAESLIRHSLEQGAEGELLTWFKYAIGAETLNKIKAELEKIGVKTATEKTAVQILQELSANYLTTKPNKERIEVYWMERDDTVGVASADINRIGGLPIGVDEKSIPMVDDDFMQHIFTLDLETMPLLKRTAPKGARAMALFVASPSYNEAYTPDNDQAKVLFLSEADIAKGELELDGYEPYAEGQAMKIIPIEVPLAAFAVNSGVSDLKEIHKRIYNAPALAAGEAIWLQGDPDEGIGYSSGMANFMLQFDEKFADLNLGDSGIMYVFDNTAFWQCY